MLQIRRYGYRIYPSKKDEVKLYSHFSLCAELYNYLLTQDKNLYESTGKGLSKYDMTYKITELKRREPRFKAVYSQVLYDQADRLSKAFNNYFRRCKEKKNGKNIKVGYPRYKKLVHSITYPQIEDHCIRIEGNCLRVPKIGCIPIILHRPILGTLKGLTIKRTSSGRWFAIFTCEVEVSEIQNNGSAVGVDRGLKNFLHCSDGNVVNSPQFFRKAEKRLAKEQRKLSKKKRGSNNARKQKVKVALIYEHVANQRADWLHKLSRKTANDYRDIAIEDLNVQRMMHNHYQAKSIIDAGWSLFVSMLEYKVSETGARLLKVDARNTTQTCSNCGNLKQGDDKIGLKDRAYYCSVCGLDIDRDLNAARNILSRAGLARSNACGDGVRPSLERAVVAESGTTRHEIGDGIPR